MAYCSFGKDEDHCGAVQWALHDSTVLPLLSCNSDLSSWLKDKYPGSGASGSKGRPTADKTSSGGKQLKQPREILYFNPWQRTILVCYRKPSV